MRIESLPSEIIKYALESTPLSFLTILPMPLLIESFSTFRTGEEKQTIDGIGK